MKPDIVLQCPELDAALAFYTDTLGFRLDLIFPADAPRVAELSGYDIKVRLQSDSVRGSADSGWHVGRAGMQYRDLIPGRQGGALIASHIRIPEGGPVADYVHYHHVNFQIIYTYKGWVRVVYEDQGPPFVMRPGDCVLQPPGIRHRVLECSDGFEVIEIGSPAEHETFVEHEMSLPNRSVDPERIFDGQRFVFDQAKNASWRPWQTGGFAARDTGVADATGGVGSVQVVRPTTNNASASLHAPTDIQFCFVLQGALHVHCGDATRQLATGDSHAIPRDVRCELLECSEDLELLVVSTTSSGQ